MVPSIGLLIYSLMHHFLSDSGEADKPQTGGPVLQPVLPGLNLPHSQLFYYISSLLISSVYHEAGHAVSAFNGNIKMVGAGLLIMAIFPAAFVELPTEHLTSRSAKQQLRVYCAGVWHNTVLALFAWLMLVMSAPMFSVVYETNSGVVVVDVKQNGFISGPSGLKEGDVITDVQGIRVSNISDYKFALAEVIRNAQTGLCVDKQSLESLKIVTSNGDKSCCPNHRSDALCFSSENLNNSHISQTYCLPVRDLVNQTSQLEKDDMISIFCPCSVKHACVTPHTESNLTKLVIIKRRDEKDYLFVGNPGLIYQEAILSGYVPKFSFVPYNLADYWFKIWQYIMAFSGGLAVLNVVPSYLLDGHHIVRVLVEMIMPNSSNVSKTNIVLGLSGTGTLLIALNILLGIKAVIYNNPII